MSEKPTSDRRYESYSHEQLYAEVGTGNDPAGAGEISQEWAGLAGGLREIADSLSAVSGTSESAWRGSAAEAMRSLLGDAVSWSQRAAEASDSVGRAVAEQAEAAARARTEMPEPVSYDPSALIREAAASGDVWQLVGLSEELTARRAEADEARQRAVDVMYARDSALDGAVPNEDFPAPPPLAAGNGRTDREPPSGPSSIVGRSVPV